MRGRTTRKVLAFCSLENVTMRFFSTLLAFLYLSLSLCIFFFAILSRLAYDLNLPHRILSALETTARTWVNQQVRNVATLGGHVGWAHPCSDFMPILMASGCSLGVLGRDGKRYV